MKTNISFIVLLALGMTACAYTPSEVIKQNSRFEFSSTAKPISVAKCVARNADESDPAHQSQLRDGEAGGSYEVVIRIVGSSVSTLAVFQVSPARQGSLVNAYLSHNVIVDHKGFAQKLLKGC